ncbi:putative Tetraspanin-31 [Hypsibius exemplaris]|uniref:Tetraspanin-31 n=1 Tax=Hypsibius exemplaris TaxID=2072580 RepID=A0A1W0WK12_HYPEX|nr:putative Tetraspanin-31 [Hypsibius exemplaris]
MQNYANMAPLGGFGCARKSLVAVNVLYICVSIILLGAAGYGLAANSISSFGVVIAILTVSVLLFLIAVVGIVAAVKHHQVMLFFYMVILFVLFIVQFSVACACLSIGDDYMRTLMGKGYSLASKETKIQIEENWGCCGFYGMDEKRNLVPIENGTLVQFDTLHSPSNCSAITCPTSDCSPSCFARMELTVKHSLRACGGIGLFFSFTEVVGIFMALRFRNQKNPHIDPSDFL